MHTELYTPQQLIVDPQSWFPKIFYRIYRNSTTRFVLSLSDIFSFFFFLESVINRNEILYKL